MMNDSSPEITKTVRERLLEKSGAERVLIGSQMFEVARAMILASFPQDLSEVEKRARLCERLYGDEVDVEAFTEHLRAKMEKD